MQAAKPEPWYREPWPWILAAGPLLVVVAASVSAWLAFTSADALVQDDYYKEGKAINRQLRRDQTAIALGLAARAVIAGGHIEITLANTSAAPLPGQLRLLISHPTQAQKDQLVTLGALPQGRYTGRYRPLEPARYYLTLEDPARSWRLQSVLRVPGEILISLSAH
jgi:uncharacterized protein